MEGTRRRVRVGVLLVGVFMWVGPGITVNGAPGAEAQGTSASAAKSGASSAEAKSTLAPPASNVTPANSEASAALSATTVCGVRSGPGEAALYDNEPIKVEVKGLQEWLKKHDKALSTLVLFLDGRAIPKLPVRLLGSRKLDIKDTRCWGKDPTEPVEATADVLVFDLQRDNDSNPTWRILLARPDDWNFKRTFKVGVGLPGNIAPDSTGDATVRLSVVSTSWARAFIAIVIASLVALFLAGYWTNMLRDTTGPPLADGRRPFSLGRVQMAFWFFLVVAAFVLIYLVTGDHHNLTTSALWLIGISSATGLGSIAIDVLKQKPPAVPPGPLAPAQPQPAQPAQPAQPVQPGQPAQPAQPVQPPQAGQPAQPAQPFVGQVVVQVAAQALLSKSTFFQDLLGTDDGDSLHRLQMLIWTVVLGAIFVYSVLQNLAMPEFSNEALALMGLSGGTYVGFKLKEKA
jgi:hypothetical protein